MSLLWWVIPEILAGIPIPFLHPERRLNQGGHLSAFDDDLPILHAAGIRAVVSLLNLPGDEPVYHSAGFDFLCLPVADGDAPTRQQFDSFVRFVDRKRAQTNAVAVHCEAGLGRTGTMLAGYLISNGQTSESSIASVRNVEPAAIETLRQVEFLNEIGRV